MKIRRIPIQHASANPPRNPLRLRRRLHASTTVDIQLSESTTLQHESESTLIKNHVTQPLLDQSAKTRYIIDSARPPMIDYKSLKKPISKSVKLDLLKIPTPPRSVSYYGSRFMQAAVVGRIPAGQYLASSGSGDRHRLSSNVLRVTRMSDPGFAFWRSHSGPLYKNAKPPEETISVETESPELRTGHDPLQARSEQVEGSKEPSPSTVPAQDSGQGSSPHGAFYKSYGFPILKVALGALFTYQLLYWSWLKLEAIEEGGKKEGEMQELKQQLVAAVKERKGS